MWLANHTRPDITYAVNYLARFQANPNEEHWIMMKRIMRYLNGTRNKGLTFDKDESTILDAFVDAAYLDDPVTKRSTTGYLIRYHGNIIAWKSKLQRTFATSTSHAEYVAICDASSDILFLSHMIDETLNESSVHPVTIFEDNSSCVTTCENPTMKGKLKHLDKSLLTVKNHFENKELKTVKINTKNQLADLLTKPLTGDQFQYLSQQLISNIGRN